MATFETPLRAGRSLAAARPPAIADLAGALEINRPRGIVHAD